MDETQTPVTEEPAEDLEEQLQTAKEEIQSLTQQLNCLLVLTKNAWRGDEAATVHLGRVIGIDPEIEKNAFSEKKTAARSGVKKTVKIADNDEIVSRLTPSIVSSASHENIQEEQQEHVRATVRSAFLQPFLKQSHIDPIRGQSSRQIFNNMIRHHQNETHRPAISNYRNIPSNVRPRATKHLYRPASADHVIRHLGSPLSRPKPYFVFAGKEFFQQTSNCAPLYPRATSSSNVSRQSQHSDVSDESELVASQTAEPVAVPRPQTAKPTQQTSTIRFGTRSIPSDVPTRTSSALSNASSTKLSQMSERERRDAMRLQRQLNLPRQGWINQRS